MTGLSCLLERYRALVCDLDGVIYRGQAAVPHAVEALSAAGLPVIYATNNASRTPGEVAEHLVALGLPTSAEQVINSSMAGAAEVARRFPAGSPVLAIGGDGVAAALRDAGLSVVTSPADPVVAVLQGYGPQVRAVDLGEAAYAIQGGALWVATNDDLTLPTDRGIAPGNGALVAAVALAVEVRPLVMGKPQPPLYLMASERLGVPAEKVLGIGDRLETDVAGATAAGMDCLLVCTGVHGVRDAARAPREYRPRFVLPDLRGLTRPYADPSPHDGGVACGAALARIDEGRLSISGDLGDDGLDGIRAALVAIWTRADEGASAEVVTRLAEQIPQPR